MTYTRESKHARQAELNALFDAAEKLMEQNPRPFVGDLVLEMCQGKVLSLGVRKEPEHVEKLR